MPSSNVNISVIAELIFEDFVAWKNINQIYNYVRDNKKAGIISTKLALNQIAKRMFDKVKDLNPNQINELKSNFNQKDWELISFIICEQKLISEQSLEINQ